MFYIHSFKIRRKTTTPNFMVLKFEVLSQNAFSDLPVVALLTIDHSNILEVEAFSVLQTYVVKTCQDFFLRELLFQLK